MLSTLQPLELHNGDRMSRDEFMRRWEQIPELKHAELIKRVVYLPSQVSIAQGSYKTFFGGLLRNYAHLSKQNLLVTGNTTLVSPDGSSLQPDVAMARRGRVRLGTKYLVQIPDLVVEISYSSQAYDLWSETCRLPCGGIA